MQKYRVFLLAVLVASIVSLSATEYSYDHIFSDRDRTESNSRDARLRLVSDENAASLYESDIQEVVEDTPWLFELLESWKAFLAERPEIDYLPEVIPTEQLTFRVTHQYASAGYSHDKYYPDLTGLVFAEPRFKLRDAVGVSNLIAANEIAANNGATNQDHYLSILADQDIYFDTSYNQQTGEVTYERVLGKNKNIILSCNVPLVRRYHTIGMNKQAQITPENRKRLTDASAQPRFYETYNNSADFITKVLQQQGCDIPATQERLGIGDITIGATYLYNFKYIDRSFVGAALSLGTSAGQTGLYVWEPELGNGGATACTLFGKASWHRGKHANPYIGINLTYHIPVRAVRRTPIVFNYDGTKDGKPLLKVFPRTIIDSDIFLLKTTALSNYRESTVRYFASQPCVGTLYKGIGLTLSIGTTFEQCFDKPLSAGIGYEFTIQAEEDFVLHDHYSVILYDTAVPIKNTGLRRHVLATHASYRLNEGLALTGGLSYCIAGKNTPAEFALNVLLHWAF